MGDLREVADGVFWLESGMFSTNVYLAGTTLIDAGTKSGANKILRQLDGREVEAIALTHVHPPTHGAVPRLVAEKELEVFCGTGDADTARFGKTSEAQPKHWFNPVQQRLFAGVGHPVKELSEGDRIGDFEVLETPGHSPGHLAFWRAGDGVLIVGDIITNGSVFTGLPGLREPPGMFTPDPARKRESARRLADLDSNLILFGHGKPLRDTKLFRNFVATLAKP